MPNAQRPMTADATLEETSVEGCPKAVDRTAYPMPDAQCPMNTYYYYDQVSLP